MNLCPCATFGETELLKVLRSIGMTVHAVNSLGAALSEALSRIEKNQAEAKSDAAAALERIEARINRPNIIQRMVNSLRGRNQKPHDLITGKPLLYTEGAT
jgi:hypothetical protein